MKVAVDFRPEFVSDAQKYALLNFRTISKQIEYWYNLGKIAEANSDLPLNFIKGVLKGQKEMESGKVSPFEFRNSDAD